MTPEAALVKLSHLLGQHSVRQHPRKLQRLLKESLRGELSIVSDSERHSYRDSGIVRDISMALKVGTLSRNSPLSVTDFNFGEFCFR